MWEHHYEPLLPRKQFLRRLAKFALIALVLILGSLAIGVAGYATFEGYSIVDAFLNAAMLMGGMGPIGELHTDAGKIFAGVYALYCGLVELVAFGIFAAPIFHRFMHHFHLEGKIVREVSFAIWQISLTTIGGCQRYTFGSLSPMAYNRQQPMVFRVDLPNDKQPTPWAKHKNLW